MIRECDAGMPLVRRPRVLLLCHDERLARGLTLSLEDMGLEVCRSDGGSAPDLILADADMPLPSEVPVSTPKILFSRQESGETEMTDTGKIRIVRLHRPFLLEKLRTAVRHCLQPGNAPSAVPHSDVPAGHAVSAAPNGSGGLLRAGELSVRLTRTEWALYTCLREAGGQAVSREQLARLIRQDDRTRTVDVYVCYLRRKLEALPGAGRIVTYRGQGYGLAADPLL